MPPTMTDEQKIAAYRVAPYTEVIVDVCGCSEIDACEILQIMYAHLAQTHHIYALDRYTRDKLAEMALDSHEALKQIRADDPNFTLLF